MWEIYMMEFAGSAADHVDRSADAVEHLLPEGLLVKLEERLAREGRLPQIDDRSARLAARSDAGGGAMTRTPSLAAGSLPDLWNARGRLDRAHRRRDQRAPARSSAAFSCCGG